MGGKKIYSVRFTGRKGEVDCDPQLRTKDPEKWRSYICYARKNKATTVITCLCREFDATRTQRRLKACYSEKTDNYWLALWQYTGNEHAPDCKFYSVWSDEDHSKIYSDDVVKVLPDGKFRIKLNTGLQQRDVQKKDQIQQADKGKKGPSRRHPSMRLLGLLHFLWEQSKLNTWHPYYESKKARDYSYVAWRLNVTAGEIIAGRTALSDVLLTMTTTSSKKVVTNRTTVDEAIKNKKRLVIISSLATYSENAEERLNTTLPLAYFGGFPNLLLTSDVLYRLKTSFHRELKAWRKGKKVILIAESDVPERTFSRVNGKNVPNVSSKVIDVALMTVSPRFIPYDSSYEELIEEKLWKEKRSFIKPLRYDGLSEVFPDFILNDVPGREAVPLEVFGMETDEYLNRKEIKLAHYRKEYGEGNWWCWNACQPNAADNIPPFPEKTVKA
ncbi:DUF1173 family protein [Mixta intestinalis]|uniref:DUF1173 domain-containing protein n=1 Tax=Mixta intestinalis TaxID=1615494 RepID=A0A6P1Q7D2_9GAMM|nr:DUF1173 family protein [Mixta intestinalis]QHM73989.1 hypothetical protein C7M51_04350 [Mixta intestinalis]